MKIKTLSVLLLCLLLTSCNALMEEDPNDPMKDSNPPVSDDPIIDNGPYSLKLTGTNFNVYSGKTITAALVDILTDTIIETKQVTISEGTFNISWMDILDKSKSYRIDYYANVNSNSLCDFPTDGVWSKNITFVSTDIDISVTTTSPAPDGIACKSFSGNKLNFSFSGSGYTKHEGKTLKAIIVDSNNSAIGEQETIISFGTYKFVWGGIFNGGTYQVHYFIDSNNNDLCERPIDDAWTVDISVGSTDIETIKPYDVTFTSSACLAFAGSNFNLTITGNNFAGAHGNQTIWIAITDDNDTVISKQTSTVKINTPEEFSFIWGGILETGKNYNIYHCADSNNDDLCGGNDHCGTPGGNPIQVGTTDVSIATSQHSQILDFCNLVAP